MFLPNKITTNNNLREIKLALLTYKLLNKCLLYLALFATEYSYFI
jgi:hypothetical protein